MMTPRYSLADMTMDPNARAPEPGPLTGYASSYTKKEYFARADPLEMIRVGFAMREALRAYDEECVAAALRAGATWQEIGDALGMERQNAHRKYRHLSEPV